VSMGTWWHGVRAGRRRAQPGQEPDAGWRPLSRTRW
jgi:hypothetical protein